MDKLLAGTGFTYKIEKGYIVLVPVPVKQEQTEATSKKIQGVIVDTNGDPVIGASIQEKGVAGKGTVSDLDGKFNHVSCVKCCITDFIYRFSVS